MFEEFGSIEVIVARKPSGCDVGTVGEHAEVREKPHPRASNQNRKSDRNDNAQNRAAPKRHQWYRIRIEDAVGQTPRENLSRSQRPAAGPTTNDVPHFV